MFGSIVFGPDLFIEPSDHVVSRLVGAAHNRSHLKPKGQPDKCFSVHRDKRAWFEGKFGYSPLDFRDNFRP